MKFLTIILLSLCLVSNLQASKHWVFLTDSTLNVDNTLKYKNQSVNLEIKPRVFGTPEATGFYDYETNTFYPESADDTYLVRVVMIVHQNNQSDNSYIDLGMRAVSNGFRFASDRHVTDAQKWDTLSFVLPAFAGAPVVEQGAKINANFRGDYEIASYSIFIDQISQATEEPIARLENLYKWFYVLSGLIILLIIWNFSQQRKL